MIYNNLDNIFELESADYTQVILKVNADSPLKVAKYPFISGNYAYITVTRGENHILTVIRKDGSTFDFHWGSNGHTLISDSLELLRQNVIEFIESCDIIIAYDGTVKPSDARIYFNSNFHKWQLNFDGGRWWSKTATNSSEMIEECKRFVTADSWKQDIAVTGITIWKAVKPKFTLK